MLRKKIQNGREFAPIWFYDVEVSSNMVAFEFLQLDLEQFDGNESPVELYEKLNDATLCDWQSFLIYDDWDESDQLIDWVMEKNKLLVGYNNDHYDNCILNRILDPDFQYLSTPERIEQLHKLTKLIIETDRAYWPKFVLNEWYYWHKERPYFSLDLLGILTMNQNRPSLKHCGVVLKFPKLQDLPFEPGEAIPGDFLPTVKEYNKHDVRITAGVYLRILPDIDFRFQESRFHHLDLFSASDTKIAKTILNSKIKFPANGNIDELKNQAIQGKDLIPKRIQFHNEIFKSLVEDLEHNVLDSSGYVLKAFGRKPMKENKDGVMVFDRQRYKKHFSFDGIDYVFGVGGMHSADIPGIFETTADEEIIDADVTSYYPFIILNEEICPPYLNVKQFLNALADMVWDRVAAKEAGEDLKAQRLKIAINSLFGLLKSIWWKLYYPQGFFSVTIAGQLYLLDLVEKLAAAGIQTISANTDGIICRVPKALKASYEEVCQEWQERTKFNLEFDPIKKYIRLNVNSYLTIKPNGKVKRKKDFESNLKIDKTTFGKGFKAPVIALALNAYFLEGIPPEKFIGDHDDIYDFCFTQRMGKQFKPVWRTEEKLNAQVIEKGTHFEKLVDDFYSRTPKLGNPTKRSKDARAKLIEGGWLDWEEEELQRTNRYFVSNSGRYLIKVRKSNGAETRVFVDQKVQLLNDLEDPRAIDPWLDMHDVKYEWYVEEVQKRIDEIENPPKKKTKKKAAYLTIGYRPEKSIPEIGVSSDGFEAVSVRRETPGIDVKVDGKWETVGESNADRELSEYLLDLLKDD